MKTSKWNVILRSRGVIARPCYGFSHAHTAGQTKLSHVYSSAISGSGPKILRGKHEENLMGHLDNPKRVGVGGECAPSHRKLKCSFILGLTKSHLISRNTFAP